MKDFTWTLFCETGNIDTYLLYKELDQEGTAFISISTHDESLEDPLIQ